MSITVVAPGLLTSVQDLGRHGHGHLGVGVAGAMDGVALRLANMLVGNAEGAAGLEITLRGPRLRFAADALIAITGAELDARCDGNSVPLWRTVRLRGGRELALGGMRRGARSYLAVAGGIGVEPVLGSRSVDLNAGIGCALAIGDTLAYTPAAWPAGMRADHSAVMPAKWSLDAAPWFDADGEEPLHVAPGAHFDCLDPAAQRALFEQPFRIGTDSNRVGYRLDGAKLALREPLELVSAGVVPGTLQLPPDGAPIVLMSEAPTTGGYPRIGHVSTVDLPRLAQRRPGDGVRFTQISLAAAQTRWLERERALAQISRTIAERLQA